MRVDADVVIEAIETLRRLTPGPCFSNRLSVYSSAGSLGAGEAAQGTAAVPYQATVASLVGAVKASAVGPLPASRHREPVAEADAMVF